MNLQEIDTIIRKIRRLVNESRLRDAFALLTDLSEKTLDWETTRHIQQAEESYKYMLAYAAKGVKDAGRAQLYASLKEEILTIADKILRKVSLRDVPTLYYNTLRFEGMRGSETIPVLIDRYRSLSSGDSLLDILASGGDEDVHSTQTERENVEKRLFDRIWVSFPLAKEAARSLHAVFYDKAISDKFKQLLVGALLMGEVHFHDPARIDLMIDSYSAASTPELQMAALVAVVLSLNIHRERQLPKSTADRIAAMREQPMFVADLKEVMMELVRSSDAERLTNKLRDEIIPEMLKLRPDISKKLTSQDGMLTLGDLEENPEWADKIEKSGLGKKLRELSDLQEEGSDVMLGAFAQLKNFPFFNDVVNWLRPYDPANSHLSGLGECQPLIDSLEDTAQLCDSDKYSFSLSLSTLPDDKKQMLSQALEAQAQQMAEAQMAELRTEATSHKVQIRNYVRNLYRFFRLFRRKGEFNDPFTLDLNLTLIPILGEDLLNESNLMLIGEFLFRRGYWDKALKILQQLTEITEAGADIYQKLGYCEQRLGNISKALNYYRRAELLDADNHWTLRRIAACYRMEGATDQALEYFKRLEKIYPDDVKLAMNIGHCLLEMGRDAEAAEYFYKVEFLDEKSNKALRPLAWSLLRSRQIDKARAYYQRVLSENPTAEDYLNMGHLALAENNFKEASNYYNMYIELNDGDVERFVKAFNDDKPSLTVMGVDSTLIPLVIDQIIYLRC